MKTQELYKDGGLSGAVLKWVAILSMAIDHFGAGYLAYSGQFVTSSGFNLYQMSRFIGRLAFPIFTFFNHSRVPTYIESEKLCSEITFVCSYFRNSF